MTKDSISKLPKKISSFLYLFFAGILFYNCQSDASSSSKGSVSNQKLTENQRYSPSTFKTNYIWCNVYDSCQTIFARINPPAQSEICTYDNSTFESWLQHLPLLPPGSPVKSYSGEQIPNQSSHAAVINIDVGEKNLQQCADAAIRLRGEYLFATHKKNELCFTYTSGEKIPFERWKKGWRPSVNNNKTLWSQSATADSSYVSFKNYLFNIFNYAGSISLSKELMPVHSIDSIRPGDMLVQGGNPGHVMTVVEISINKKTGKKYFLLCQSFMPAQSIHIVKNHSRPDISPWFDTDDQNILTPGWPFNSNQFMRWK